MPARRIGILGGTFDPIHLGHLEVALAAQSALKLMRVFVITSSVPPHRSEPQASPYHRFVMTAMAVAGRTGWRVSDQELRQHERSYTSETLRNFHGRGYSPLELYFIVGADAFAEISSWKNFPMVLDYAHFAVVSRPGCPAAEMATRLPELAGRMMQPADTAPETRTRIFLIDSRTSDVSSTAIRERCARGESIAGLVPDSVQQHIEQHGLYTSTFPGRRGNDPPL